MLRTCLVLALVFVLAPALIGTTTSCGSGGSTFVLPPGTAATYVPSFMPSDSRVDQPLPATLGQVRSPVAACQGNSLYAVWGDTRNGNDDIFFNVSTDNGATWQPSNTRLDTNAPPGILRDAGPAICVDGANLYVAWGQYDKGTANQYYMNRSLDGGATWLPTPVVIDGNTAPFQGTNIQLCCDGNTVIATWSDNRSGDYVVYVARSTDDGLTWSEQPVGGAPGFDATDPRICCDVVGMNHYVYVAWDDNRNGQQNIYFDRSIDGGVTFGADVQIDSSESWFLTDLCCDGQYVYVGWSGRVGFNGMPRLRGSSDFGATFAAEEELKALAGGSASGPSLCCEGMNVYAVFHDSVNGERDVFVNRSLDAGLTVGAQVRIDSDAPGSFASRWPRVHCNAGNLAAIWLDERSGTLDIWGCFSPDGGLTWNAEFRMDVAGGVVSVANFTTCADGAAVYGLWSDPRDGPERNQVQVNYSTTSGAVWQFNDLRVSQPAPEGTNSQSDSPDVCVAGSTVHTVWADTRLGERRIFYNRSDDSGETWQATDVALDTGLAGTDDSNPRICCKGNVVHVIWTRAYDTTNFDDVYVNTSQDGGMTWLGPTRVNTGIAANTVSALNPRICCDSGVYVVWSDDRFGDHDIFCNRSIDNGTTWLPVAVRVDNGGIDEASSPRICCSGFRLHVVWSDARNGARDIYTNVSLDGGLSWLPIDTRLDVGDAPGANWSSSAEICCDGPRVYVAWRDSRNGDPDIYFNRSVDAGATWLADDRRLDSGAPAGVGASENISLCCSGDNVYAVWDDERDGDEDVYFNRSLDAGETWLDEDVRLDTGDVAGAAESDNAEVCCFGDRVYVIWDEERPSNPGPYLNVSLDAGATWMPDPVRASSSPRERGAGEEIVCDGTQVTLVWFDNGGAAADIYLQRTGP